MNRNPKKYKYRWHTSFFFGKSTKKKHNLQRIRNKSLEKRTKKLIFADKNKE